MATASEALTGDPAYTAVLARCRAEPWETTHRLALADRLTELGWADAGGMMRGEAEAGQLHACQGQWLGTHYLDLPRLPKLDGVNAFYVRDRGLVAEVRCSLREWVGFGSNIVCNPLAAVTRVTLTGKVPLQYDDPPAGTRWTWLMSEILDSGVHHVTNGLYRQMRRGVFETEEAAADELSSACIRWAGLPF